VSHALTRQHARLVARQLIIIRKVKRARYLEQSLQMTSHECSYFWCRALFYYPSHSLFCTLEPVCMNSFERGYEAPCCSLTSA
jgi:hypothetical protein